MARRKRKPLLKRSIDADEPLLLNPPKAELALPEEDDLREQEEAHREDMGLTESLEMIDLDTE